MRVKKVQTRDGFKYFYGDQQISMDVFDALSNMSSLDYYDSDDELSFYGGAAKIRILKEINKFKPGDVKRQQNTIKTINKILSKDVGKEAPLKIKQYNHSVLLLRTLLEPGPKKEFFFKILHNNKSKALEFWENFKKDPPKFWKALVDAKREKGQEPELAKKIITINLSLGT